MLYVVNMLRVELSVVLKCALPPMFSVPENDCISATCRNKMLDAIVESLFTLAVRAGVIFSVLTPSQG